MTSALRVAVLLPTVFQHAGEFFADVTALEAAGADAVLVEGSAPASFVLLGGVAAVTHSVKVGCLTREVPPAAAFNALDRISGGRAIVIKPGRPPEAWTQIEPPADRAAWKAALAAQEAAGAAGIVVPWDPRLIDLLRNPGADDDRSDLMMSTG